MDKKVSIIVPIFNGEGYIEDFFLNLKNQSYSNFEVILINDGSTDGTNKICNNILNENHNVIYLNNKNQGVSFSRNCGLRIATGTYVLFLDIDDYFSISHISTLVENIEKDISVDLSVTGYKMLYTSDNHSINHRNKSKIFNRNQIISECIINRSVGGYLWNKLFKLDIIKKQKIEFKESCYIGEDTEFVIEYCLNIDKAFVGNGITYEYRVFDNGTMKSSYQSQNTYKVISHMDSIQRLLYLLPEDYHCEKKVLATYFCRIGAKVYRLNKKNNCSFYEIYIDAIRKYIKQYNLTLKDKIIIFGQLKFPTIFNMFF